MPLSDVLLQQLANGLILGSFYALVALGYSMVYGVIKLLNFAHGDLYMVGAFAGFAMLSLLSGWLGGGWAGIVPAIIFSMVAVGALGVIIDRVAYRPLREAPKLSVLITALAVSMLLENIALAFTGGQFTAFATSLDFAGIDLGMVHVTWTQ
ncbi:MAG: branched-chain amino acid ABC transporter permease, partial [Acetobacteraceae bacterium]